MKYYNDLDYYGGIYKEPNDIFKRSLIFRSYIFFVCYQGLCRIYYHQLVNNALCNTSFSQKRNKAFQYGSKGFYIATVLAPTLYQLASWEIKI